MQTFSSFKAGVLSLTDTREAGRGAVTLALRNLALRRKSQDGDTSFAGEFFHLTELLNKIGVDAPFCVDIAAGNGVTQSCTNSLFQKGWDGLAVELDGNKFSSLSFVLHEFQKASLARVRVTPFNVADLFSCFGVSKKFGFLNLDIDSYDLDVMRSILSSGYRPNIVSMEINEKIPSSLYFEVPYSDEFEWEFGDFYGCSLGAAYEVMSGAGYILESLQFNNAFFIDGSLATPRIAQLNVQDAYARGYWQHPDRLKFFPWNARLDYLQHLRGDDLVDAVHLLFASAPSPYDLRPLDNQS